MMNSRSKPLAHELKRNRRHNSPLQHLICVGSSTEFSLISSRWNFFQLHEMAANLSFPGFQLISVVSYYDNLQRHLEPNRVIWAVASTNQLDCSGSDRVREKKIEVEVKCWYNYIQSPEIKDINGCNLGFVFPFLQFKPVNLPPVHALCRSVKSQWVTRLVAGLNSSTWVSHNVNVNDGLSGKHGIFNRGGKHGDSTAAVTAATTWTRDIEHMQHSCASTVFKPKRKAKIDPPQVRKFWRHQQNTRQTDCFFDY